MRSCQNIAVTRELPIDIINSIECNSRQIAESSYNVLLSQSPTNMSIITGAMTIFVALFGLRLMLGWSLSLRDVVVSLVKIGLVLAISSSWISYHTLVYDVAINGTSDLAYQIGGGSKLVGTADSFKSWLQRIDKQLIDFAFLGPGNLDPEFLKRSFIGANGETLMDAATGFWDPVHEENLIQKSRSIFLVSAIGTFALLQLSAGIFIAIGPMFIAFIFFERTQALFFGWIRILMATIVGGFSTSLVFGVEAITVSPWLQEKLTTRISSHSASAAPSELFVIVSVFSLAIFGSLIASFFFAVNLKWSTSGINKISKFYEKTLRFRDSSYNHLVHNENSNHVETISRAKSIANSINKSDQLVRELSQNWVSGEKRESSQPGYQREITQVWNNLPIGRQVPTKTRKSISASRREDLL